MWRKSFSILVSIMLLSSFLFAMPYGYSKASQAQSSEMSGVAYSDPSLFNDGFESGDFSAWTRTSGSPTVVTDYVYNGSYSMRCASSGSALYAEKSFSGQITLYARCYVRLNSTPPADSTLRHAIIMIGRNSTGPIWQARFSRYANNTLFISIRNMVTSRDYAYVYSWQPNIWYCIEVKCVISPTAGELRLYLDGSEVITRININTGSSALTIVRCGITFLSSGWKLETRHDCVVFDTAYIGPVYIGPPPSPTFKSVVLVIWDGTERSVFYELLNSGQLPNVKKMNVYNMKCNTEYIGGGGTWTIPQHSIMFSGYLPDVIRIKIQGNLYWGPLGNKSLFYRVDQLLGSQYYIVGFATKTDNVSPLLIGQAKYWPVAPGENIAGIYFVNGFDRFESYSAKVDPPTAGFPRGATETAVRLAVGEQPFLYVFHVSDPDEYGHKWGVNSTQYRKSIKDCDALLGRLIEKLPADTVFIVTSDHGFGMAGDIFQHGYCPNTFIASNINLRNGLMVDIAPTIYEILGIDISKFSPHLNGRSLINRPPVALFTESATIVYKGDAIHFNASKSYDPDGRIVRYLWTFGDGTNTTGVTVDHIYTNVGNYTVTLTVTDNDGATAVTSATKIVLSKPPVASFTESATIVYTGEVIDFDASGSYDPDGMIVNYSWNFGDGTNATGITIEHAYVDDGVYTVTLIVTDDDGANATTSATKTVLNSPPIAMFTESAETVLTGEPIYFNASLSYDPDGSIMTYFWDFGDGTNVTGVVVSHAYADNGNYTVTLTLTDDDDATSSSTATKTVLNRAPVAEFTESAETVYVGESLTFNASGSCDSDGIIVSYFWDFGDGANATGMIVSHVYATNGTFMVTLTITDNDGASNSTSSSKTVLYNEPPVALFTESAETVYTGEIITFNASASYDPDGTIVSYFWTFGDGTNTTSVFIERAYVDDGIFTVTLTATDDHGATGTTSSIKTVLNRPPVASFTESAETVLTAEVIYFNASASYDPDGYIVSYFWDFGDGTNSTGALADHSYADDDIYSVSLTLTDNDGATSTITSTKTVLNRLPVASFTESNETVYTGEVITFNASESYDPDGSIVSYTWNFGDGNITTVTSPIMAHAYSDDGTYTMTLTVEDNDGATSSSSSTKTVLNRPPIAIFTESATNVSTGEVIYFNASGSYDPDGLIVSYFWTFGDGTNATGVAVSHAYSGIGVYTVTLTVTDNDGGTDTVTATKTVG